MISSNNINELVRNYSNRLVKMFQKNELKSPKTYGFEYEFIAAQPLSLDRMKQLFDFLQASELNMDKIYLDYLHTIRKHNLKALDFCYKNLEMLDLQYIRHEKNFQICQKY